MIIENDEFGISRLIIILLNLWNKNMNQNNDDQSLMSNYKVKKKTKLNEKRDVLIVLIILILWTSHLLRLNYELINLKWSFLKNKINLWPFIQQLKKLIVNCPIQWTIIFFWSIQRCNLSLNVIGIKHSIQFIIEQWTLKWDWTLKWLNWQIK